MNGQMAQDLKLVRGHVVTPLSLKASLAKHYIFTVANVYNMMLRLSDLQNCRKFYSPIPVNFKKKRHQMQHESSSHDMHRFVSLCKLAGTVLYNC